MFVARIHNNSLGSCFPVDSSEEGVEKIKEILKREGVTLSEAQLEELEDTYEIILDNDPDNITSFTVGMLDDGE